MGDDIEQQPKQAKLQTTEPKDVERQGPEVPVETIPVPTSRGKKHRPGHGIATVLLIIITGLGIALSIVKLKTLFVFLPIYCIALLAYVLFVCCVNNEGEDDAHDPKPRALIDYLSSKKRRARRAQKKKKLKKIQAQNGLHNGDKGLPHSPCQIPTTGTDRTDETFSLGADDIELQYDRVVPSFCTVSDRSTANSTTETFENELNIAGMFTMPNFAHVFDNFESQCHDFATHIRHRIKPPHQCYACKNGISAVPANAHRHTCVTIHAGNKESTSVRVNTNLDQPALTRSESHVDPSGMGVGLTANVTIDEKTTLTTECCNLTGKYRLVHNHNFDPFLKTQNVPMLIRKAACASRPIHTITHNGNTLRIQVDGITKGDTTFIINGPPSESNIRHLKFEDHVTYAQNGSAIQVRKVGQNTPKNAAAELIITRKLGNNGHNLLLASRARFHDGSESLEAVQTFHRIPS